MEDPHGPHSQRPILEAQEGECAVKVSMRIFEREVPRIYTRVAAHGPVAIFGNAWFAYEKRMSTS